MGQKKLQTPNPKHQGISNIQYPISDSEQLEHYLNIKIRRSSGRLVW
jgi:hypothetical protein